MIRISSRFCFLALGLATLVSVSTARAQDTDALRKKFLLNIPDVSSVVAPGGFFRGAPGTNTGSPLAFAPGWGDAFVGVGFQAATRGIYDPTTKTTSANGQNDGSVSVGFGLGNATDAIALEVDIASLSTFRSGLGNRTAFGFKAARNLDNTSAIAVGVESAFIAGNGPTDGTQTWYGVASHVFMLSPSDNGMFKAVTASVGLGNGRFRFIQDVAANKSTVNAFASASILVIDEVSAIADYSGQDLDLGLSLVPFKAFPIVFTPALSDVTGTASKTMRFTLGVGVGMHF